MTEPLARNIVARFRSGESIAELASEFHLSNLQVQNVIRAQLVAHVDDPDGVLDQLRRARKQLDRMIIALDPPELDAAKGEPNRG